MTCIVGIEDERGTFLGSDAIATDGRLQVVRSLPKTFARGPYIFGCSGSIRLADVVRHAVELPDPPPAPRAASADERIDRLHAHLTLAFVPAVRKAMKRHGLGDSDSGDLLLALGGFLWSFEEDLQVSRCSEGYAAAGAGAAVALGSLYSTRGKTPKARIQAALAAAEHHSAHVRGRGPVLHQPRV